MAQLKTNEDGESSYWRSLHTEREFTSDIFIIQMQFKAVYTIIVYLNISAIFHHFLETVIVYKSSSTYIGKMTWLSPVASHKTFNYKKNKYCTVSYLSQSR
jgi:hypothetical protein